MTQVSIKHQPNQEELQKLGVFNWPIWEKEASVFPWHYDSEETCYLLEDDVTVTSDTQETFSFSAGDLVVFAAGLSCIWNIKKPVKKHYSFA